MDEVALQHTFAQCLQLAERLETQQFNFICTEVDLPFLQLLDEAQRAINTDEALDEQRFRAVVETAGLTPERLSGSPVFSEPTVRHCNNEVDPYPYRPLAERLQDLQHGVLCSQAQGILRFDEDPELCWLPQTVAGLVDLLRAERYWDEFSRDFSELKQNELIPFPVRSWPLLNYASDANYDDYTLADTDGKLDGRHGIGSGCQA